MANNFVIRKGLIVSGSDTGSLIIQGTTGQLVSIISSSQGNTFSVNSILGVPTLRASGSVITLGPPNYITNRPIEFSQAGIQLTSSAQLNKLSVSGRTTQGLAVTASQYHAHAEGESTKALGIGSHAEGGYTITFQGSGSHVEGYFTSASGDYSHAEGYFTVASGSYQHVQGQYNVSSSNQSVFIHGNGVSNTSRSNLIVVSGSQVEITGSLKVTGSIVGSYSPAITQQTATTTATSTYTLVDADTGKEFLFRTSTGNGLTYYTITLPYGLKPGFLVTITTLNTPAYILTGSNVTLVNNKGTTIPVKASATIINTGTANEYLVLGDL